MTQTALPLYPKISSIYNKIMQLAIAIVFIIILMNIWIENVQKDQQVVNAHFNQISDQYIQQLNMGLSVFLENGKQQDVETFINKLVSESHITSIFLYDVTGQTLAQAGEEVSIKSLYGLEPNTRDLSRQLVPFVAEIRTDKVLGYVRINILKSAIVDVLNKENHDQQQLVRMMLMMAGLVGFFLTRGLSRFSRQGYRIAPKS